MTAVAETIETSWMSTAVGPSEYQTVGKSATVEKTATFSRDTSSSSMNLQLQHQQHPDVNSRHATKGMPEILEMPTTVLASAGTPTAQ
jgi:hypothetical protein